MSGRMVRWKLGKELMGLDESKKDGVDFGMKDGDRF